MNSTSCFLAGLDIGTSSVKATVYTSQGDKVLTLRKPLEKTIYQGSTIEQDPIEVLASVENVLANILSRFRDRDICIGLSSTSPSLVPIDSEGNPLYNIIAWMDRRAVMEAKYIEEKIGKKNIVTNTGLYCDSIFTAPKILWLRKNNPSLSSKVKYYVQLKDFVFYHLTQKPYTDFSHISETLLYTLRNTWYTEMIETIGITVDNLFHPLASTKIFELNPSKYLRRLIDINRRVYIALGGVDSVVSNLGTGAVKPYIASDTTGTSTCINVLLEEPKEDLIGIFEIYRHVLENYYILESALPTSGYFLDKILELTGTSHSSIEDFDYIPSRLLVLPFLDGTRSPDWNPKIKGLIYGLSTDINKHDLIKGTLEGVAFWIRNTIEIMNKNGLVIKEIRSGGGGGSGFWNQIKANITGVVYKEPVETETSSLGAAILAGLGSGIFRDAEEAVNSMVKIKKVYTPNSSYKHIYDERYHKWLSLWRLISALELH